MSYPTTILADSPSAYWHLAESSGATFADASGSGNDLSIGGGTPTFGVTGIPGNTDTAVTLNGAEGSAVGTFYSPGSGGFTLEAWVKTTSTGSLQIVLGASNPQFWIGKDAADKALFKINGVGLTSPATIADGAWHHIVGVRESTGALHLYLDGAEVATDPGTAGAIAETGGLELGAIFGSFNFAGSLDEVAIYQTALTGTRVLAHYNAGTSGGGPTATTATLGGPTSITATQVSTEFSVSLDNPYTGTVTPATTGTGTFRPTSLTWSASGNPKTFTYQPTSTAGTPHHISITASPSLTIAGSPVSLAVLPVTRTIRVGFIGDSLTALSTNVYGTPPDAFAIILESALGVGVSVVVTNEASPGTSANSWATGSATAIAAMQAANCTHCLIMLGANDCHGGVTKASYKADLLTLCNSIIAAGIVPELNSPAYSNWDAGLPSNPLEVQYRAAIIELVQASGGTILLGDLNAYQFFSNHQDELSDGVHLAPPGSIDIAQLWVNASIGHFVQAPTYASASDVRLNTDRGDGVLGTLAVPAASRVFTGTAVDATTGTLTLPSANNLLRGTTCGIAGSSVNGNLDSPFPVDVRFGTATRNNLAGQLHVPSPTNVLNAVLTDNTTGTLTIVFPSATNLASGIVVSGGGTTVTGTAVFGGGGGTGGTNVIINVSGSSFALGASASASLTLSFPSGSTYANVDALTGPAAVVWRNQTQTALVPTITHDATGVYSVGIAASAGNGFANGDSCWFRVSGTYAGGAFVVDRPFVVGGAGGGGNSDVVESIGMTISSTDR